MNFSPGHAGRWAGLLATSIGLQLDFVQLEGAGRGCASTLQFACSVAPAAAFLSHPGWLERGLV